MNMNQMNFICKLTQFTHLQYQFTILNFEFIKISYNNFKGINVALQTMNRLINIWSCLLYIKWQTFNESKYHENTHGKTKHEFWKISLTKTVQHYFVYNLNNLWGCHMCTLLVKSNILCWKYSAFYIKEMLTSYHVILFSFETHEKTHTIMQRKRFCDI